MRLAAIDVGSNASKLLISNVYEVGEWMPVIRRVEDYRVPLRLGEDAFIHGRISEERTQDLIKTMSAFNNLMSVCQVENYMACATSAMRSANNGPQLVERIRRETGINMQIFDGAQEAEIISLNRMTQQVQAGAYLYVDVGGGSVELTLHADGKMVAAGSFNVGLVRIKENLATQKEWDTMKRWVRNNTVGYRPLTGIGSGGNINKLFELTRKRNDKPLSLEKLKELHDALDFLSYEERMLRLGLRPDRADVIVPACKVFISVMQWAGIDKLYVPNIGLADGIIHYLYRLMNDKND
ncbi:MAG: exopolyphosphatase [Magnetococcales bacterium]|nr:exopolyphosphatase [Magnetococcales bacterium]